MYKKMLVKMVESFIKNFCASKGYKNFIKISKIELSPFNNNIKFIAKLDNVNFKDIQNEVEIYGIVKPYQTLVTKIKVNDKIISPLIQYGTKEEFDNFDFSEL